MPAKLRDPLSKKGKFFFHKFRGALASYSRKNEVLFSLPAFLVLGFREREPHSWESLFNYSFVRSFWSSRVSRTGEMEEVSLFRLYFFCVSVCESSPKFDPFRGDSSIECHVLRF